MGASSGFFRSKSLHSNTCSVPEVSQVQSVSIQSSFDGPHRFGSSGYKSGTSQQELHKRGIKFIQYLDDWLIHGESPELVLNHTRQALELTERLAFVVNVDKVRASTQPKVYFSGLPVQPAAGFGFPSGREMGEASQDFVISGRTTDHSKTVAGSG